jgi:primosomal protein N' (replication factor Y)
MNNALIPYEQDHAWAEVILPLALPKIYTYSIPAGLIEKAKTGCRVEVVFGKNKKYAGIIRKVTLQAPAYATKPLLQVLDDDPLLFEHQLQLWQWMAEYYMCSEGEVMAAALPANFKLSSETILMFNEEAGDDFSHLDNEEFLVAEALLLKKQLQLQEIQQILDASHVYPVIKRLLEKNICYAWERLQEKYSEKKENFVSLHPDLSEEEKLAAVLNEWKGAPKQMELLLSFLHLSRSGDVTQSALLKKSGASAAQLKGLVEKGYLKVEKRRVDRIPNLPVKAGSTISLSEAQQSAYDSLLLKMQDKSVTLLQGVTGSGKTLLYIKLMASLLESEGQILYLLPEIALTTQIISRLLEHFGGHVAVYHSRFNDQERVELWNKVRQGSVRIVLGPRSALLLPFRALSLIIVDEEHDASYKQQEPAPRYHARDTAIYYASLMKAKVLLGSATPSLESYQHAISGKYGHVELKERFGGLELPAIEIINTASIASKGKIMISPELQESIRATVESDRQVILFQNRRGYNPYLLCGKCGHIPQCDHCDVSLTLHKLSNKLHCHYCGSSYPRMIQCKACGSQQWLEKNFGTEKIEEQLQEMFPAFKIARMDVDTVKGKKSHENLIRQLETRQIDVLVGTQMVVKGLDFDRVALVGILDADGLLSFTDFRVNERAFQLMEQVSGRAGRKHARGKVLIQSMQPGHPVLQFVMQHDFRTFFEFEIARRKEFFYPPFSRLIMLTLRHKDKQLVMESAHKLANLLRPDLGSMITGPAEPIIGRIRNQYIMEIMIRLPRDARAPGLKKVIANQIMLMQSEKRFSTVQVIPDVDAN